MAADGTDVEKAGAENGRTDGVGSRGGSGGRKFDLPFLFLFIFLLRETHTPGSAHSTLMRAEDFSIAPLL